MARIKSEGDIARLREGGMRLAAILRELALAVRQGAKTIELDRLAELLIRSGGDEPAFLNYRPEGTKRRYPASLCVSVNDEVVHGIPGERILREGDLVGLDLGLKHKGLYTDSAVTVGVGALDEAAARLIVLTREAMMVGVAAARAGNTVGDIGHAVQSFVAPHGYGIVRELGGHGVGHKVHEPPYIGNVGRPGEGEKLEVGMVLAIEPMINEGGEGVMYDADRFTCRTRDGSRSAHFEHTVVINTNGPEIITR